METKLQRKSEISLNELVGVGVSLVVVGLIFVYGIDIVKDVRDDDVSCSGTHTYNISAGECNNETGNSAPTNPDFTTANQTMEGLGEIPQKLPTIAIIIAVAVIIAVLLRAFAFKR